jgi:hypothetical protein
MNGMIGAAGTRSLPSAMVIGSPRTGSMSWSSGRGMADMMGVLVFGITAESRQ